MRKLVIALCLVLLISLLFAGTAYAWSYGNKGDRTYDGSSFACTFCHKGGYDGSKNPDQNTIPHGNYTTTSDHCSSCHEGHVRANKMLLPRETLSQTCNYCHDFTGAKFAVYRLNGSTSSYQPKSGHRVLGVGYKNPDGTDFSGTLAIPGGNDADGGFANLNTMDNGELANTPNPVLSCDSCHTPHGVNTVNRYIGESDRNYSPSTATADGWIFPSSRILRNKIYGPNATTPTIVNDYGPQWCAACHSGRDNIYGGSYHNHPVDLSKKWGWGNSIITLLKGNNNVEDPRKNNVYVMRDIGAADGQVAYSAPMCQQCHASPRDVTQSFSSTNPEQQYRNFPHQSYNASLLVEEKDNLCLNCHTPEILP